MPLKIMVIDSDIYRFQSIRDEFSTNYTILSCSRSQRALELYKLFQPQAVIINIQAADLNAENLIGGIQQIPGSFLVPLWIINCDPETVGSPQFLSLHPFLYMEGPIRPSLLRAKLDNHFKMQKV